MVDVLQKFHELGVVPVVVLDDAKDAEALGKALCDGGLPVAEVTFRTAAAEASASWLPNSRTCSSVPARS